MTTLAALKIEFEHLDNVAGTVPLFSICEKYLVLGSRKAGALALTGTLPLPAFRLGSQKSPWLVSLTDLAHLIDRKAQEAKTDWEANQVDTWPIPRQ